MIFRIHIQNQGSNHVLYMKFRIESTDSLCVPLIMYDFSHTFCGLPQNFRSYEQLIDRLKNIVTDTIPLPLVSVTMKNIFTACALAVRSLQQYESDLATSTPIGKCKVLRDGG